MRQVQKTAHFAALPKFIRFGIVGCFGFIVDVGVLYFLLYAVGLGHYAGRLASYIAAASATWYLNGQITFPESRSANRTWEWLRFVAFNALGGLVNYAVYATYISVRHNSAIAPAIGVAIGSLAGMLVNFLVSKQFVFRKQSEPVR
jgi:putative flippase GtrA